MCIVHGRTLSVSPRDVPSARSPKSTAALVASAAAAAVAATLPRPAVTAVVNPALEAALAAAVLAVCRARPPNAAHYVGRLLLAEGGEAEALPARREGDGPMMSYLGVRPDRGRSHCWRALTRRPVWCRQRRLRPARGSAAGRASVHPMPRTRLLVGIQQRQPTCTCGRRSTNVCMQVMECAKARPGNPRLFIAERLLAA